MPILTDSALFEQKKDIDHSLEIQSHLNLVTVNGAKGRSYCTLLGAPQR